MFKNLRKNRIGHQWVGLMLMSVFLASSPTSAAEQHMMKPRVPADKIQEARSLTNPLPQSPDIVAKGKTIYEGKGTCVNCHGVTGHGNGPGSTNLDPPPRVFRSRGFWRHRTEGEIFWVIKHGSPGTAMIPFGGLLSDEEIWTVMQYERGFAGRHGRGSNQERHKGMGKGGKHGGKGMHGRRGGMRYQDKGEHQDCCSGRE